MDWYKNWHNHPRHRHAHLLIFFSVLFLIINFLFVEFLNFYLEQNITRAQTILTFPCRTAILGSYGLYANEASGGNFNMQVASIGPNETFDLIDLGGGNFAIRSTVTGLYANAAGVSSIENFNMQSPSIGQAETLTFVGLGGNRFSIRSSVGRYAYTEGANFYISSINIGPAETLTMVPISGACIASSLPPQPPPPSGPQAVTPCDPSVIFPNIVTICDIAPRLVKPGDTVSISGYFMGNVVQLSSDTDGIIEPIEGNINNTYDILTFIVPPGTPDGIYGVSIASVDGTTTGTSNIDLTVAKNPDVLPPQPPLAQQPFNQPPVPIANPPTTSTFNDLISSVFNYAIMFVGIAVFIMILWAGFLWVTSAANPGNIATAKGYIFNAIMGGILLLSAYVILYTINPELVGGEFNLKGIPVGGPNSSNSTSTQSLVAFDEPQAASAITAGCTINIDRREFTTIDCPSNVASTLNLTEDPTITTTDANANNQVEATVLQSTGNQGTGRKIIVLDTGYNYNHPELSSSYLGGRDFINNDSDPMDDHGTGTGAPAHGSHVAGIITADGLDSKARGVAPGAGIISGKILGKDGTGKWSYMTDAIYWAVNGPDGTFGTADDFKADVINISVGGGSYAGICDNVDETTRLFAKAIRYAKDNGVLVVISSGNFSSGVSMPGCIDAAFTVGAVDSSDRIANFSGRGNLVDIVAPGVNIYSSLLGGNYGTKSGTSMATPVVSGLAALLKTANPSLTAYELEQKIISTACDLGPTGKDSTFGWGRVTAIPGSCTPPPITPPSSRITGTLTASPTSCTKGSIAANLNCNITLSYRINGITSATQLTVRKNNVLFQNIQCNSGTCTGQLNDPDPNAGTYQYTVSLPDSSLVATGNAYVYTNGTITANFGSCTKLANASNPNCNVTLSINAPGVSASLIVTRDGVNWRVVQCANSQCSTSIIDDNPIVGTHTYTIRDSSDNTSTKLRRVTVVVSPPNSGAPTCNPQLPTNNTNNSIELCTGTNYTGTCSTFSCYEIDNFRGTQVFGQTIRSARISGAVDARLYTCDTPGIHPNPSATEPTPCLWLEFSYRTQVPDIWNTSNNNWCYWTWVGSTATTFCGQPVPTGAGINIKSYGSL